MAEGRVISVAVDGSAHSDNAFNYYVNGIREPGDTLLLIHVPEEYNWTDASPGVIQELITKMADKAREIESDYAARLKDTGINFKFQLGYGKPGEQIVRIAEENKSSLLMVGSRGHGWLRRTVLGSVSNYVLHHTSIPVLVCKHFEGQEDQ